MSQSFILVNPDYVCCDCILVLNSVTFYIFNLIPTKIHNVKFIYKKKWHSHAELEETQDQVWSL